MSTLTLSSTITLSTGYTMPRLGFGVYKNRGEDCVKACAVALEAGYRHIDSAVIYRNEAEVGRAVRENTLDISREDVFVTSKVVKQWHGYNKTTKAINKSLIQFGFEYIDLYLVHDPISGKALRLETYRALLDAQKEGKIRTVGVSNYSVRHLEEIAAEGLAMPSVNQIELHPFCQQKPIVEYCEKQGIVIQAYTPLVHGSVDNEVLARVAEKHGKTVYHVLIRWSLQRGFVPLPKSATPGRVLANADVYDFDLDGEDMEAINALDAPYDEDGRSQGAVTWNPVNVA